MCVCVHPQLLSCRASYRVSKSDEWLQRLDSQPPKTVIILCMTPPGSPRTELQSPQTNCVVLRRPSAITQAIHKSNQARGCRDKLEVGRLCGMMRWGTVPTTNLPQLHAESSNRHETSQHVCPRPVAITQAFQKANPLRGCRDILRKRAQQHREVGYQPPTLCSKSFFVRSLAVLLSFAFCVHVD